MDKFSATGLTPVKSDLVDAPYVKEFPLIIECKVIKIVEIGLHTEFIGEIVDVKADSSVLNEKNLPDIEKVKPIIWNPSGMTYHKVGKPVGQAFSIGKEIWNPPLTGYITQKTLFLIDRIVLPQISQNINGLIG